MQLPRPGLRCRISGARSQESDFRGPAQSPDRISKMSAKPGCFTVIDGVSLVKTNAVDGRLLKPELENVMNGPRM